MGWQSSEIIEKPEMNEGIHSPSLQEVQAELAHTRTVLAMDRTLLAWIRTSLSLMAFGFTLAKFVHSLIEAGTLRGIDVRYPRNVGITLMVLGITGLLCGVFDYWRSVKRLRGAVAVSPWSASLVVALLLAVVSVLLMIDLVADLSAR